MADQIAKAKQFVDEWVSENCHPTGYAEEGDTSEAKNYAKMCLAAAKEAGISAAAIKQAVGDLTGYIAEQLETNIDDQVQRAVDKDPF